MVEIGCLFCRFTAKSDCQKTIIQIALSKKQNRVKHTAKWLNEKMNQKINFVSAERGEKTFASFIHCTFNKVVGYLAGIIIT